MQNAFPLLKIIVVAGTSSDSGKTTLVCDLLRALTVNEPWEAIKLSRGHYRSCGKDPHSCCVSGLLGEQAAVRSGRAATYAAGKDTGRFWEAGASNVHWVIAKDEQVESGIHAALAKVKTSGVIIEATSVLRHLVPSFAILAVKSDETKFKPSARAAMQANKLDALYLNDVAALNALPERLAHLPAYDASRQDALLAAIARAR